MNAIYTHHELGVRRRGAVGKKHAYPQGVGVVAPAKEKHSSLLQRKRAARADCSLIALVALATELNNLG